MKIEVVYEVVPQYKYKEGEREEVATLFAVITRILGHTDDVTSNLRLGLSTKIFWGSEAECNSFLENIYPMLRDNLKELGNAAKHPDF